MSSVFTDGEVISQFLEGNDAPLASENLKICLNRESIQLIAQWEGVVALMQRIQYTQTISLKATSTYYKLTKEMLISRHFLPFSVQSSNDFECYRRHEIPEGYVLKYTSAKLLWRHWRFSWNERSNNRLQGRLLVMHSGNWFPIQDIGFHQGLLVFKTLAATVTLQPEEMLVWLHQVSTVSRIRISKKKDQTDHFSNRRIMPVEDIYPNFAVSKKPTYNLIANPQ